MEKMGETVADSRYQSLHHMLSESNWDRGAVRRQLIADANTCFGHASALVIDESGFGKKGDKSAGVDRQWNGRLGKVDNSQVGVFAAVTREGVSALVEGELYVPENWFADRSRCEQAGIAEALQFRTKGEMALDMVWRLRREGLHFSCVVLDGGYGHLPWLLRALEDDGEVFLADVHSNQAIYGANPQPAVPQRRSSKGKRPSRLESGVAPVSVAAWAAEQSASSWTRLSVREGEKGFVMADYLARRVWLWDGEESKARCWHLLVRRELDGASLKFCLSNAKPNASIRRLAAMQAARHFVERGFEDAKGACGMADYQVRGYHAWHHHMALVMVALMFLAKERFALRDAADLLSCNDLVDILRHKLPSKINTDDDLVDMIEARHKRRRTAMIHAYQTQAIMFGASGCGQI
jgi:SRSO17 transposase